MNFVFPIATDLEARIDQIRQHQHMINERYIGFVNNDFKYELYNYSDDPEVIVIDRERRYANGAVTCFFEHFHEGMVAYRMYSSRGHFMGDGIIDWDYEPLLRDWDMGSTHDRPVPWIQLHLDTLCEHGDPDNGSAINQQGICGLCGAKAGHSFADDLEAFVAIYNGLGNIPEASSEELHEMTMAFMALRQHVVNTADWMFMHKVEDGDPYGTPGQYAFKHYHTRKYLYVTPGN